MMPHDSRLGSRFWAQLMPLSKPHMVQDSLPRHPKVWPDDPDRLGRVQVVAQSVSFSILRICATELSM